MELLSHQTNINKDLENYLNEEEALKKDVIVVKRELELAQSQKNQTVNLIKDIEHEIGANKEAAARIQTSNTVLRDETANMKLLIAKETANEAREAEHRMTIQLKLNMKLKSLRQREHDDRATTNMNSSPKPEAKSSQMISTQKQEPKSSQMNSNQKSEENPFQMNSTQKPEENSSQRNSILKDPGQCNEQKRRHVSFSTLSDTSYSPTLDTTKKRPNSFGATSATLETFKKRGGAKENSSPEARSPHKKLKRSPVNAAEKSQTQVKQEEKVEVRPNAEDQGVLDNSVSGSRNFNKVMKLKHFSYISS